MREIRLFDSRILLWRGAAAEIGENVRAIAGGTRAFVLTDRNCRRIAEIVRLSLAQARFTVHVEVLPSGEVRKSLAQAHRLYGTLLRAKADRATAFVTVGGGVVGDLGGFVASTYMRGLPLFHVPTTLLAQVDASIGGKTGVNLPQGKNLVGTFYQPRAVFLDPDTLASLPNREYVGGLAEVVKCAVIRDADLFALLGQNVEALLRRDVALVEEVVFRCASIKAAVVQEDERESGVRAILNYGHTIGHALEAASGYRLHHGEAVAIGMVAEAALAREVLLLSGEAATALDRLLLLLGLPLENFDVRPRRVLAAMAFDKKSRDGRLKFALPEAIGRARFDVEVPDELVRKVVGA